ncbi:MAG: hypothetical protein ABIQ93_08715 [Saprospiraceae bacterium]
MENSLLLRLWKALPEAQRRQVGQALRSPAFNQRGELVRLLDFIEKYLPAAGSKPAAGRRSSAQLFTKEAAFHYIFSAENSRSAQATRPFDDGKMRHLMTYLLDVIRECLAWQEWRSEAIEVNLHYCRALKKLGLDDFHEKELERAKQALDRPRLRHDGYYFQRFALEQEAWELRRQKQRSGLGNVQAINTTFGVFVAINSLRQGCTLLAQKTLVNVSVTVPYLAETLRLAAEGMFQGIPAVEAWHTSYLALQELGHETQLSRLKNLLEQHSDVFPDADLRDLYILALNVCIRRINAGDKKYVQEAFDLYKTGLQRGVFLENGWLSKFTYRNVLNIAVALQEWDWALAYLHEFQAHLPPKDRENIFKYNLATFYFRQKDYQQALTLLPYVELRDTLENFDSRRMLLLMYFERKEWQALSYLLDSFGIYLQRHKEGGYHREMYLNLVRFLKKMIAQPVHNEQERQKLRAEIAKTVHLAEREWLLSVL